MTAVLERLGRTAAAPLPAEPLRRRALDWIGSLVAAGAEVLAASALLTTSLPPAWTGDAQ